MAQGCSDRCGILAKSHQRVVIRDSVRAASGEIPDGLDVIGLPLPVWAENHGHARPELNYSVCVIAEVGEFDPRDDHKNSMAAICGAVSAAAGSAAAGNGTSRRRHHVMTAQ